MNEKEYQEKRQWAKELRVAYRTVGRELVAVELPTVKITIPDHAHVQPTDDGAFVECVMWVPKNPAADKVLADRAAAETARLKAIDDARVCKCAHRKGQHTGPCAIGGVPSCTQCTCIEFSEMVLLDDDIPF